MSALEAAQGAAAAVAAGAPSSEEVAQLRVVAAEVTLLREVMGEAEERCGAAERRMREVRMHSIGFKCTQVI